jgi:hypothetical protein
MTLADKISLIDQMIRENSDYTIRDYLSHVKEIESVENSMEIKRYPSNATNGPYIFHQTNYSNGAPDKKYS